MNKTWCMIIIILGSIIALIFTFLKYREDIAVIPVNEQEANLMVLAPYENTINKHLLISLAKKYSELPNNPEVKICFISKNDYKKEISMSINQGTLADLIICENTVMPSLINMDVFVDISDYIYNTSKIDNYYPEMWNNTRSNGKYYGIPFLCDPYVFFWNKNLLANNLVTPPDNWSELMEAAELLQGNGIYGFGIGIKQDEEATALFMQLLYTTGGSIREINGEEGIKVFQLLEYFRDHKLIPRECINWTQLDLANEFSDGKIAMMVNSLSTISVLKDNDTNFEIGISNVPIEKKENYMFHGKNIGITTSADYEKAMGFLKYLTQEDIIKQIANTTDTIPVMAALDYNFDHDYKIDIDSEIINKQKDYGIAKSSLNSWLDISVAVSEGIYELLAETNSSVDTIADTMQDKVRIAIIDN